MAETYHTIQRTAFSGALHSNEERYFARLHGLSDTAWMRMTTEFGMKEFLLMSAKERDALARQYGGELKSARELQHVASEWPVKKWPVRIDAVEPVRDVRRMMQLARGWKQRRYA